MSDPTASFLSDVGLFEQAEKHCPAALKDLRLEHAMAIRKTLTLKEVFDKQGQVTWQLKADEIQLILAVERLSEVSARKPKARKIFDLAFTRLGRNTDSSFVTEQSENSLTSYMFLERRLRCAIYGIVCDYLPTRPKPPKLSPFMKALEKL